MSINVYKYYIYKHINLSQIRTSFISHQRISFVQWPELPQKLIIGQTMEKKHLWRAQSQTGRLYHTLFPRVQRPSRERGQRNCKSSRLRRTRVGRCLLGATGPLRACAAAAAAFIRPTQCQVSVPACSGDGLRSTHPSLRSYCSINNFSGGRVSFKGVDSGRSTMLQ